MTPAGYSDIPTVAGNSIRGLRQAYPNYFMNLSDFLKQLDKLLK